MWNGARFVALPLHASIALIHNTTQRNTTQHITTQHYTTLHYTTLHYTTQHNATPPSSGVGRCRHAGVGGYFSPLCWGCVNTTQSGVGGYFSPLCWPAVLTRLFSLGENGGSPLCYLHYWTGGRVCSFTPKYLAASAPLVEGSFAKFGHHNMLCNVLECHMNKRSVCTECTLHT